METKTLKKSVGNLGEDYSSRYLESRGYTILGRNVYVDKKEIDIVAEKDGVISFVEVKTRTFSSRYSTPLKVARPADAVSYKKRMNIATAALSYISQNGITKKCRFDVIEIYFSVLPDNTHKFYKINHIEGAFDANGNIT